jgi:hypothetical protein
MSGGCLERVASIGCAGAELPALVFLDVEEAVDYPTTQLDESRPFPGPPPPFKGPMADSPPIGKFDLIEAIRIAFGCRHFRVLSFGQV